MDQGIIGSVQQYKRVDDEFLESLQKILFWNSYSTYCINTVELLYSRLKNQPVSLSPAALLLPCMRVWKFPPRIPLLCSSSAGEKQLIVIVFLSSSFPLFRKSRAGEFLAGTFKHACTTVIKRQDLKRRAGQSNILIKSLIWMAMFFQFLSAWDYEIC